MPGRWDNLNIAFLNMRKHVLRKRDQNALTVVDLLYVRNFKGGNASIIDPEIEVNRRLTEYSDLLKAITKKLGHKSLGDLTNKEKHWFKSIGQRFIELPLSKQTSIRGFGVSYASALLAAHLPELAPVLDRNVLLGAGIRHSFTKQGQVVDIRQHYGALIDFLHSRLAASKARLSLRNLDEKLFSAGRKKRRTLAISQTI